MPPPATRLKAACHAHIKMRKTLEPEQIYGVHVCISMCVCKIQEKIECGPRRISGDSGALERRMKEPHHKEALGREGATPRSIYGGWSVVSGHSLVTAQVGGPWSAASIVLALARIAGV